MNSPRPSFYKKLTASVPLFVTVIVHVVLVAVAGYFVVSEQLITKKKNFEAANAAQPSIIQKQVEHRLQVARKGGGSASASPVSASRIFAADANALQLTAPAELNLTGASALAGMGFGSGTGGIGAGTGYGTGIGSGSGLGSGFMSMSFLGLTNQKVSKVVFIVDISPSLLDIRKGGFEAFAIIRSQIMTLISRLPPSAEFNVVLYDRWNKKNSMASFDSKLVPATVANKTKFFAWMKPVNEKPELIGLASVLGEKLKWTPKPLPGNESGANFVAIPLWATALHYSLEMEPDSIFLISGTDLGPFRKKISDAESSRRESLNKKSQDDYDRYLADLKSKGTDPEKVKAAQDRAWAKATAEFEKINEARKAKGKPPYIIQKLARIFEPDFQAALKRDGFTPVVLDKEGWTDKQGHALVKTRPTMYHDYDDGTHQDLIFHIANLQRALLKERSTLNIYLFAGPKEQPNDLMETFSKVATKNGGKCVLLTTKRIKELEAQSEADK